MDSLYDPDQTWTCLPLGRPTRAEPGTEEKIRVMEYRYSIGCHIHHPEDLSHLPSIGDYGNTNTPSRAESARLSYDGLITSRTRYGRFRF